MKAKNISKHLFKLLIITLFVSTTSCCMQKIGNKNKNDKNPELVISYKQTSQNRDLPVYKIELYTNKQMYLTAEKNLDKQGKYMRTLTDAEYNQVIKSFSESNFFNFNNQYSGTNSSDSNSERVLFFSYNGKQKTIEETENAPEELKELQLLIQSFLDRVGWEKMSW